MKRLRIQCWWLAFMLCLVPVACVSSTLPWTTQFAVDTIKELRLRRLEVTSFLFVLDRDNLELEFTEGSLKVDLPQAICAGDGKSLKALRAELLSTIDELAKLKLEVTSFDYCRGASPAAFTNGKLMKPAIVSSHPEESQPGGHACGGATASTPRPSMPGVPTIAPAIPVAPASVNPVGSNK